MIRLRGGRHNGARPLCAAAEGSRSHAAPGPAAVGPRVARL